MGFFDKLRNSERMRKIRESGKDGEDQFRREHAFSNIKRKHHGKDFEEYTTDWTGRTKKTSWEVKRNNSPLSKKQMRTRNLHVRRYVDTGYGMVESRTEDKHGNRLEQNILTGKYEKVKKQKSLLNIFGSSDSNKKRSRKRHSSSSKKKHPRSKSDNIFGSSSSIDSIFGSNSHRKKKRSARPKKKRGKKSESIWGSSSGSAWGASSGSKRRKKSVW